MNVKRFIGASVAVFCVLQVLDFIIHNIILDEAYMTLRHLWRPDMMDKVWIMYATSVLYVFLFMYIFVKGYENKGIAEGIRFGIVIGLFANIPYAAYSYVIYPLPLSLCVQWFIYGMIKFIILGIAAAAVYRPKT